MNWRGQVLWVADLGQFLGDNIMLNTETTEIHVIVIEDQETLIALAVDRRVDMEWLDTAQLEQVMTGVGDLMAPFLKGEWLLDSDTDQKLRLLDHVAIIRSARWAT
jgi:twitching motility protein PilI